jgi:peptidoglycan/xylan/chitin deacetylase (PgdA/CDA1 family)
MLLAESNAVKPEVRGMDKAAPSRELVLCLHGIGTAPPGIAADELPYWQPVERFAACLSMAKAFSERTGASVLATFDDGNRSDLSVAAPLLRQHGVAGAFFVCAGRLGKTGYLDASDARELANQGFVVGSHGMDHVRWTSLRGRDLYREIVGSRLKLEDALGREVSTAAIPFGAYNRRVLNMLRGAGYRCVFSSDRGISPPGAWMRRRWTLRGGEPIDFDEMLRRSCNLLNRATVAAKEILKAWR